MYEGNPGEIDFGPSLRDVRVSKGLSYRESTAYPSLVIHTLTRNGRAGLKNSAVAWCSIAKGDLTKKIPLSIALSFLPEVFSITSTST